VTESEVAYLAGLLDGEGTFSIQVNIRQYKSRQSVHLCPRITICIKYGAEVLDWVVKTFGGKVYERGDGVTQWYLGKVAEMRTLTELVVPHLRIKKAIAERFLEALRLFPEKRGNRRCGERSWTEETTNRIAYIALTLNPPTARKSSKTLAYLVELKAVYDET
jgi:hypothetical protein